MGGGAAASTAMERHENKGTAPWLCFPVRLSNGIMTYPPWGDHLRPIEVRRDIRMGDPNVPQSRGFGGIQYCFTEIDLGGGGGRPFWMKNDDEALGVKSAWCEVDSFWFAEIS